MAISPFARRALTAALLLACAGGAARAASPKFFVASTQPDFLKGDLENLSVDARGELMLGPASELVYETPSPFLWTVVPSPDGNLFVGTGNDGRVYRIDAQGRGSQFFDATELEIHAIAPGPNGGIYAASSPDGQVYKIDRSGKGTPFFDPAQKYIWALATDARGNVFAATGERGVVYRIAPDGNGTLFYDTKATHATALAFDKTGNLFIGTESPGRVIRVDAQGKGFLLLDTPYRRDSHAEVRREGHALRRRGERPSEQRQRAGDTGGRHTATDQRQLARSASRLGLGIDGDHGCRCRQQQRSVRQHHAAGRRRVERRHLQNRTRRSVGHGVGLARRSSVRPRLRRRGARGGRHGRQRQDLQARRRSGASGASRARAGLPGHVALQRRSWADVLRHGQPGQALTPDCRPRREGHVRVRRARRTAGVVVGVDQAGAARRRRPTEIEVSTRSGNTETPDDAWSDWSTPYTSSGSSITSPKARYLQWRAVLSGSGDGPTLTSVTAAYLPRNLRPVGTGRSPFTRRASSSRNLYSTGNPDLAGFDNQTTPERKLTQAAQNQGTAGSSLGRRTYQKGLETLQWRADDENDDELSYDVLYRREGETSWKVLRTGLTDSIVVWDTTTVPNGTYFVRVVASDAPSNATSTALTGELESSSFDIDNTPPTFVGATARLDGQRTIVSFEVRDDHSPISRVEYATDGDEWTAAFPTDGIADSKTERYEVAIDGRIGPRGLTLRAMDAMNNVSTTQVDAPAPR
ncbi:MAG: SMP-30/gluconolactonase/LRE family protein [Vicinamibacterales bacterium]